MKKFIPFFSILSTALIFSILVAQLSSASPYGKGKYNENVPYGSQTYLSIATNGDVNLSVTPTNTGTLATNTSIVTVSSTDVVGYKLYVNSIASTNLTDSSTGATIPASANGSPLPLVANTWGYNTDASTNFTGLSLSSTLARSVTGPISNDQTTFTYGVYLDLAKPAGSYKATILYTAVPQTT